MLKEKIDNNNSNKRTKLVVVCLFNILLPLFFILYLLTINIVYLKVNKIE